MPHTSVTVPVEAHGVRLDKFLADALKDMTRSRWQALIKSGAVRAAPDKPILDPGHRVRADDVYVVTRPEPMAAEPVGECIPLTIVFEDKDVIVIDKPAGLVVHPAVGHATGTMVNALIAHCGDSLSGIGGVRRPGIVHRLDKDTSGLLVVAKNDKAHQSLAAQFAAHGADGRLQRTYAALVWGRPLHAKGTIDAALARSTGDRTKFAVSRSEQARHAVSHYEVVASYGPVKQPAASLVHVTLETGRTHQIRVHMAHIGHPVIGDPVYGRGFAASVRKLAPTARSAIEHLGRQALHAVLLGFEHPRTGRMKRFTSALPEDMAAVVRALGGEAI
jgi:23S rRNA pseudouridine1911/1915/1917 synthase